MFRSVTATSNMVSENRWKVLLLIFATTSAYDRPNRALSIAYKHAYNYPMFVPKTFKRKFDRQSRVLFLDEEEQNQPFGKGEIDLTIDKSNIKFDDTTDYDFVPDDTTVSTKIIDYNIPPSGNERFYDAPRLRPSPFSHYIPNFNINHGRFGRQYAPSYPFEPYFGNSAPSLRNSYYNSNGWRARSPRVVFPFQDPGVNSLVQTNSHSGPVTDNNVVFREQNFGTTDVVGDDLALQDLGTTGSAADAFAERDVNIPHHARKNFTNRIDTKMPYNSRNYDTKPMFREKVKSRIDRNALTPFLNEKEKSRIGALTLPFLNITRRAVRENVAILPKFKPITDEQMLRITQIMSQNRYKSTNNVPERNRIRKGKKLEETKEIISENYNENHIDVSTERIDRQDEKKCAQGGTCEFFVYCWMVGGLLEGSCGGLLKGCCHRVAKAGLLGVQDSNSIDYTSNEIGSAPVVNDESCGIAVNKQTAQRRIVGGDDAGFGTFPWQAYIRIGSSRVEETDWERQAICGGSLISRRHVVTAGHCVARAQPRHVRVTLGDYVINSAAEPLPAYTFGVRTIKVHPLFKFTPQADRFDVAVLTLDRNVHYMPHIAPICLPERGSDYLGQYGWAAGWGALNPGSRLRPRTLQAVDVPVLDNRVCERWHRANGINVVIYPEMLCAGYRGGGKDSCQGDSGGPLMLERTGRWYLIGVVSAGYSCASRGQPGIYHRVAHTVDWISHVTTLS